jgi:hypothetical protein
MATFCIFLIFDFYPAIFGQWELTTATGASYQRRFFARAKISAGFCAIT